MSLVLEFYRLNVTTQSFELIDVIDGGGYANLEVTDVGNEIGGLSFTMNVFHPALNNSDILRPYRTNVAVKRNGTIIFVGPIIAVGGTFIDVDGLINVQVGSYLAHFRGRLTSRNEEYSAETGQIMWSLIANSQAETNGTLLVSLGTLETTPDSIVQYQNAIIGDEIVTLARNVPGVDFRWSYGQDADGNLTSIVFNVYSGAGSYRNDLPPLRIGTNVQSIQFQSQDGLYNYIVGEGAGTGDTVQREVVENTGSQESYTRRELFLPAKNELVVSGLNNTLLAALNSTQSLQYRMDVTLMPGTEPAYGNYQIGDVLLIDFVTDPVGFISFRNTTAQISEITLRVDDEGVEFVELGMILVV